jgi:A/G-specific adenine glycosylase
MRQFEWRKPGRTAYSVLVAEVLLRRTTSKAVSGVYSEFLHRYPDVISLAKAEPKDLLGLLSRIGLQGQRLRGIQELATYLLHEHGGKIWGEYEKLREIPHVGRYTANAVLSFGFGKSSPIVDSNVTRILRRVFASEIRDSRRERLFWAIAEKLVPVYAHECFNWGLLDIGATICTYRTPHCEACPLVAVCDTGLKMSVHVQKTSSSKHNTPSGAGKCCRTLGG